GSTQTYDLDAYPVVTTPDTYEVRVGNQQVAATLNNKHAEKKSQVNLFEAPPKGAVLTVEYTVDARRGVALGDASKTRFTLETEGLPVVTDPNWFNIAIGDNAAGATRFDARIDNTIGGDGKVSAIATITQEIKDDQKTKKVFADFRTFQPFKPTVPAKEAKLCTNFTEYKNAFGDFSLDPNHRQLTHAVYGFFNNGGTRCYVVRVTKEGDIGDALSAFELVDDISL